MAHLARMHVTVWKYHLELVRAIARGYCGVRTWQQGSTHGKGGVRVHILRALGRAGLAGCFPVQQSQHGGSARALACKVPPNGCQWAWQD